MLTTEGRRRHKKAAYIFFKRLNDFYFMLINFHLPQTQEKGQQRSQTKNHLLSGGILSRFLKEPIKSSVIDAFFSKTFTLSSATETIKYCPFE